MPAVLARTGLSVALLVLGAVVGLGAVVLHERWVLVALVVAAPVSALVALPPRWWARPPFALGFAVPVGLGATPRPEGDYLVGSDPQGYLLLALTAALVLASVVTLAGARRRERHGAGPGLRGGAPDPT